MPSLCASHSFLCLLVSVEYLMIINEFFMFGSGCLLTIKVLKYVSFSSRLGFLLTMLKRSAMDILTFLYMLSIFVCAFGFAGYMLFGNDVMEFRQLHYAIGNMFRAIESGLDYDLLLRETPVETWVFALLFEITWGVFVMLVLSNVFIAILSEAYANVQIDFDRDLRFKDIRLHIQQQMKAKWEKTKKGRKRNNSNPKSGNVTNSEPKRCRGEKPQNDRTSNEKPETTQSAETRNKSDEKSDSGARHEQQGKSGRGIGKQPSSSDDDAEPESAAIVNDDPCTATRKNSEWDIQTKTPFPSSSGTFEYSSSRLSGP